MPLPWERLRALFRHPEFRAGAKEMSALGLGIGAWGLVTGVAMVKTGMGTVPALLISLLVFSGTAQLATAPLIASGAPMWVVWATAACVNLRFVVYSAQWRPYLVHLPRRQRAWLMYWAADWSYVKFMHRWPQARPMPGQLPYFWGGAIVNAASWHLMSVLGIVLAQQVPEHWGLGFAGTVALLGMTWGLLAARDTWLPAALAGSAALAAYALPLKLHMLVAIAVAVGTGVAADAWRSARPLK